MPSTDPKEFFDGHAEEYKTKYSGENKFYAYFFYERLASATAEIDFDGKTLLDVGSGTGPLYDYLISQKKEFETFIATDISKNMLDQSAIPAQDRFAGDFMTISFKQTFDLVFMLGVTTYLTPENLRSYFEKIASLMNPGAKFIVTFTHRTSLDLTIRAILSPIRKLVARKNRIYAQQFPTTYYSLAEAASVLNEHFVIQKVEGLNHTIFPFSRLIIGPSIVLARRIHKRKNSWFKRWLSSDLLLVVTPK